MVDINLFITQVFAKGNQKVDEDKQVLVRLTDVLEVVQRFNEEEAKLLAEKTKERSDKLKEAKAKKKKGDSAETK